MRILFSEVSFPLPSYQPPMLIVSWEIPVAEFVLPAVVLRWVLGVGEIDPVFALLALQILKHTVLILIYLEGRFYRPIFLQVKFDRWPDVFRMKMNYFHIQSFSRAFLFAKVHLKSSHTTLHLIERDCHSVWWHCFLWTPPSQVPSAWYLSNL
jgi:hypothetical protein